jgi:Skp family chaperone for outer membrane proteins
MNKCAWSVVAAMLIAGLVVGCGGKDEKAKGTSVGVVDFPALLAKLGYQGKIDDKLRSADQKLAAMRNEKLKPEMEKQARLQKDLEMAARAVTATRKDADSETVGKDPAVIEAYKAKVIFERRLQAYGNQYQAALEKFKRTLLENWTAACLPAMGKVGPQKGVDIILAKQTIPWNASEVDLTAAMEEHLRTNYSDLKLADEPDWNKEIVPLENIQP